MNAERSVHGASELAYVCYGDDDAAPAHKQRAAEAGAIEAVVAAMQAHPGNAELQQIGQLVIDRVAGGLRMLG